MFVKRGIGEPAAQLLCASKLKQQLTWTASNFFNVHITLAFSLQIFSFLVVLVYICLACVFGSFFQGYLLALGMARTAQVKRDARIGEAEAQRDSGIKVKVYHWYGAH